MRCVWIAILFVVVSLFRVTVGAEQVFAAGEAPGALHAGKANGKVLAPATPLSRDMRTLHSKRQAPTAVYGTALVKPGTAPSLRMEESNAAYSPARYTRNLPDTKKKIPKPGTSS